MKHLSVEEHEKKTTFRAFATRAKKHFHYQVQPAIIPLGTQSAVAAPATWKIRKPLTTHKKHYTCETRKLIWDKLTKNAT